MKIKPVDQFLPEEMTDDNFVLAAYFSLHAMANIMQENLRALRQSNNSYDRYYKKVTEYHIQNLRIEAADIGLQALVRRKWSFLNE